MKNQFQKAATDPLSEAEQALKDWGIEYAKKPDGSILVPGRLDISSKGLTRLPDLSRVSVGGDFWSSNNSLTSLRGVPQSVGGNFYCSDNQLTSLEGAPQSVGGGFYCYKNQLTSLHHAPQFVAGDFSCSLNPLSSLEGAPQKFRTLLSSFGSFKSWEDVPEHLRTSPETQILALIEGATVLERALKPLPPLKLKIRSSRSFSSYE